MGFYPVGLMPKKAAINALICRAWVTGAAWPAPETNSSFSIAQQAANSFEDIVKESPWACSTA